MLALFGLMSIICLHIPYARSDVIVRKNIFSLGHTDSRKQELWITRNSERVGGCLNMDYTPFKHVREETTGKFFKVVHVQYTLSPFLMIFLCMQRIICSILLYKFELC